ncbi:MAG TPA: metallophosphoesterase [Burkholderiaceae bacterium]|nr:metallophosphoesterase [Burkholderiaceae bacterium]
MKLNVIHISDIHFHSENDKAFSLAEKIASNCYVRSREADATLIAVTGDIAFSGQAAEYAAAEIFFSRIKKSIESETKKPVYIIFCPGNHDCILKPVNEIRELIIDEIIKNPEKAKSDQYKNVCVFAQTEYFKFSTQLENPPADFRDQLWSEFNFKIGEKDVRVSAINIAWMSRLPEQQGTLFFPLEDYKSQLSTASDLRLVLLHQPFNWQQQQSYHEMRNELRRSATAVLSGHEHYGCSGKIEDEKCGESLYFESEALGPHETDLHPSFATYLFDLNSKNVIVQRYSFDGNRFLENEISTVLPIPSSDNSINYTYSFTDSWKNDLNDPGANFIHPDKKNLVLDDIFVYPDIRNWEDSEPGKISNISSETLIDKIRNEFSCLIIGDERSGKTTLLYIYARELRASGLFPVYIKANEINNIRCAEDMALRISRFMERQYADHKILSTIEKSKRVLLVDDIDRLKSGISSIPHFLEYSNLHFGSVVLTAAQSFEISSLASSSASELLQRFPKYEILRFGQKLRHRLIRKWCTLSQMSTLQELDKRVHHIEGIINMVIGKNLVPQLPIYLLILLQSSDQHQHGEIQNSGFSHYYQYLITKSLGQVGVNADELNEYYNYLSHLTWFLHEKEVREINVSDFRRFNTDFSQKFSNVDFSDRLQKLTSARLVCQRGDFYSFAYPFVFYYFLGSYLSSKINKDEKIRSWVSDACKKLYRRENANAILFLTHHNNDPWIIESIADVVKNSFPEISPMSFNGDTEAVNKLVSEASEQVLVSTNITKNQENSREESDKIAAETDDMPDALPDENGELDFVAKFLLLFKTSEILGQVLKNYYGSLEKPFKNSLLKEVFDGPLRALGLQISEISKDLDGFVAYIENVAFKNEKNLNVDERKKLARKVAVSFLGWLGTSIVSSAAFYVASEKLRDDIAAVVEGNPTIAYRLIEMGTRLVRPGNLPIAEIEKLVRDIKDNHFAFQILQSLGVGHLYLFHTNISDKDKLCNLLKITPDNAKKIEVTGRDVKIKGRS